MLILAIKELEDLLRQAHPLREKKYPVQALDIYFSGTEVEDFVMHLLFVDCPAREIGSSVVSGVDTLRIPIDKSNWGVYFDRIYQFISDDEASQVMIEHQSDGDEDATTISSVCPGDWDVFFDGNYCRWTALHHDLEASFEGETGYDWEVIHHDESTENSAAAQPTNSSALVRDFMKAVEHLSIATSRKRVLDLTSAGQERAATPVASSSSSKSAGSEVTYRDALLMSKEKEEEAALVQAFAASCTNGGAQKSTWMPVIQVCPVQGNMRVDREYHEQAVLAEQAALAAAKSAYDNGLWGLVDDFYMCKAARSTNRVRNFTMLKPAALAKKNARIAQKRLQQQQSKQ